MKFRIIFSTILIFSIHFLQAQNTLNGKVFDSQSNTPLSGATVKFFGKGGTTTDRNGMFVLDCRKVKQITVSFIGYETTVIKIISCEQDINVGLHTATNDLNVIDISTTSNVNRETLYQPSSITKLATPELKRTTGLFLDDAVNGNVPGVIMQRRGVSSGQQFNIRGYGNGSRGTRGISNNFDGQGYKVYLNGIPVTDAEGITVLDDLDYGSLGNVEITKGPAGSLYGLAIAGVVNLNTIKPEKGKTSIGQEVLIGNYGLQRYTTSFALGGERSSVLVNYGHQKSDGFTIHNASYKDFINFAGDFQPSAKQSVTTYLGYSNSSDQRSGELTIQQYNANDYTGNIEYIKRNGHSQVYTARGGVVHTYVFNEHVANTTTLFATGFNSNASSAAGWTDKAATNLGLRTTFNTKLSVAKDVNLSGITGVETQRQNASTIGYGMIKDPSDPNPAWFIGDPYYWIIGGTTGSNSANGVTSDVYTTTATTSLFTEWTLALQQDLYITAGVGLSNMKIRLDDRYYNPATPNKTRSYDTVYNSMLSPHIAINKVFDKEFSLYASYNSAYKAPVSSYFFIPYAVASNVPVPGTGVLNSSLKAEKADQFEIGTKGALLNSRLTYQAAFFTINYNNKITTVPVFSNPTTVAYSYVVNSGKENHKGIEALVKYTAYQSADRFIKAVTPFANLTYSDFKYQDYPFHIISGNKDSLVNYSGNAVAGVAKIVYNLGFDITTKPGVYANLTYFYKDPTPITSDGLNISPNYSLLNAKLGFQHSLSKNFDLNIYGGVNNITNTKYPIMVFINQIPDAYLAGPRFANYYGGINLKYIF